MWVVTAIKRKQPREGVPEYPKRFSDGYRLADPVHGNKKHHAKLQVPVETLEEAACRIREKEFHLWMVREGKWESLISPDKLIIEYRFAPLKALKIKLHRLMSSFFR